MNIGTELRQAREARGLSIAALAALTRIPARAIDGLERNDLSAVPPNPYARGFVVAYAREVGLDPEATARAYFAQFEPVQPAMHVPAPPEIDPPGARVSWAPAIGMLAVLMIVAAVLTRPAPAERDELAPIGTSGERASSGADVVPAAALGSTSAPGPVEPAQAIPAASSRDIVVVLEMEGPAWIAATADGRRVLYRLAEAGSTETLRASRELVIRVGDAGAVRWSVDGAPAETMGRPGQVRDIRLIPNP